MSVLQLPICPTGCDSSVEPVEFNECAPEVHYGEVSKIYVAEADHADFANVEDLAEWTAALDDAVDGKIRTLIVIGSTTEPERTELPISGDRTIYSPGTYQLNFKIDETNDVNYNFMLEAQCNTKKKFWYETSDGMLYGGNAGLEGVFRMSQPIPEDRKAKVDIMGSVKWQSERDPLRCVSPMA